MYIYISYVMHDIYDIFFITKNGDYLFTLRDITFCMI